MRSPTAFRSFSMDCRSAAVGAWALDAKAAQTCPAKNAPVNVTGTSQRRAPKSVATNPNRCVQARVVVLRDISLLPRIRPAADRVDVVIRHDLQFRERLVHDRRGSIRWNRGARRIHGDRRGGPAL